MLEPHSQLIGLLPALHEANVWNRGIDARGYQALIEYSQDTGATWGSSQAAPVTSIRWIIPPRISSGSIIEVKFEAYID